MSAATVSLAELKAYLRIETSDEDALLSQLVRTAEALCEAFTGQLLIERSTSETIAADGDWYRLTASPATVVTSVSDVASGTAIAFEAQIDACGDAWVRVDGGGRAQVMLSAGLATDWNGVPEPLRQGIVRLAAHLYAHRDAANDAGPPAAVAALWRPWRRMRLS
jgi:uncharacterized phiE125 gp8 family phage protein